ncbi:MAG: hypothetical protein FD153_1646 [Rhodospirillaceae bacterium]|nr:MAG: hypothetical protein FD153_1646 [Rhodospirillaceae bacterium]
MQRAWLILKESMHDFRIDSLLAFAATCTGIYP